MNPRIKRLKRQRSPQKNTAFDVFRKGKSLKTTLLGGGFKHCLFSPLLGEMILFDKYFSDWLKPPTSLLLVTAFQVDDQKIAKDPCESLNPINTLNHLHKT